MNCSAVAERLEAYIAGDLDDLERHAVGAHLATCLTCATDHAALATLVGDLRVMGESFRPRLLPPQVALDRVVALRSRRRRIAFLIAAAVTLGGLAAIALVTVPAAAERSPLPVGGQIRALHESNEQLETALVAAVDDQARSAARLKAKTIAAQTPVLPATVEELRRLPGLDETVAGYFSARARAVMPTAVGDAARASLARYCVPGSQALVAGRSFAAGARAAVPEGGEGATRDATAVVEVVTLTAGSKSAILLVQPVSWTAWAQGQHGGDASSWHPRYAVVKEYSHKVTAVRQGGDGWRLDTVVSSDPAAAETLRAGGAPPKVVEEAQRQAQLEGQSGSGEPRRVPREAAAIVRRFVRLVNAGDFAGTAGLFSDGRGIDERGLDPYWEAAPEPPVLKIREVRLTPAALRPHDADPDSLYLTVDIAGPEGRHPLFADASPGSAAGFPLFWELTRDDAGDWAIAGFSAHATLPESQDRDDGIPAAQETPGTQR
jgi:hypothetical protein